MRDFAEKTDSGLVEISYESVTGFTGATQGWCARDVLQMDMLLQSEMGFDDIRRTLVIASYEDIFDDQSMFVIVRHAYRKEAGMEFPIVAHDTHGALVWGINTYASGNEVPADKMAFRMTEPVSKKDSKPIFIVIANRGLQQVVSAAYDVPYAKECHIERDDAKAKAFFLFGSQRTTASDRRRVMKLCLECARLQ